MVMGIDKGRIYEIVFEAEFRQGFVGSLGDTAIPNGKVCLTRINYPAS
jgi:hypothetical protein